MSEYIEFAVRVPKDNADSFIARFGKGNVKILGFLLGEEIVRCRDFEFSMFDKECSRVDPWEDETWFAIEPDGFCAWGERRD